MVSIFGTDVELISLIPAVFGAALSIYNWLKLRQPASIQPSKITNYGMIASTYQEGMLFCFPLIFTNEGANNGLISEIKIGFSKQNSEFKYLSLDGKAKLLELGAQEARLLDWEKFENQGYVILQPTYPIKVDAGESIDVYMMARVAFEDKLIPIDQVCKCRIEVYFGSKKMNFIEFPFYLSTEATERDDILTWLSPNQSYA